MKALRRHPSMLGAADAAGEHRPITAPLTVAFKPGAAG
jgi:hypothetical protein